MYFNGVNVGSITLGEVIPKHFYPDNVKTECPCQRTFSPFEMLSGQQTLISYISINFH